MKEVPLTQGHFALVDDKDFPICLALTWHLHTTKRGRKAARAKQNGKIIYMHRWLLGVADPEVEVDHENGDSLDNQRQNLRVATNKQNSYNRRRVTTKSRFKGVWKNYKKWSSRVMKDRIDYYLGVFKTEEEAAKAYDRKARELFGPFACLNFPESGERQA